MIRETLMHIDEELGAKERKRLLLHLRQMAGNLKTHFRTRKPHLLFIRFDDGIISTGKLVEMARNTGLHAQIIDF